MRDPEESRGTRGYGGIRVSMVPLRSRTESSLSGAVLHSRLPLRRQHRGVCVRGHREDCCVGQTGRKPCVPTRISSARHWHVAMQLADALRHSCGSQGTPGEPRRVLHTSKRSLRSGGPSSRTEESVRSRLFNLQQEAHENTASFRLVFQTPLSPTYKAKIWEDIIVLPRSKTHFSLVATAIKTIFQGSVLQKL